MEKFRQALNQFIQKSNVAHQQLCIWFSINNEFAKHINDWYKIELIDDLTKRNDFRYENFWNILIPTLQHSWVLSTARLLDPAYSLRDRNKKKPRISLDYVIKLLDDEDLKKEIENEMKNYSEFIKCIRELRNNVYAHNDAKFDPKNIEAGAESFFEWLDKKIEIIKIKENLLQLGKINTKVNEEISQRGVDDLFNDIRNGRIIENRL